jgi:UDP-glucose:(heptosyl)LPS alpha-1,3-glucosyltransferase
MLHVVSLFDIELSNSDVAPYHRGMKVFISRKDLKDTTSGVPKKVLQEISFFKGLGYEAYAIAETMNHQMVEEFGGVAVKTFQWPFSGHFRRKFYQKMVSRWARKHKPDVVIGHGDIIEQDVLFIHNCVHLAHEMVEGKPLPADHEVGLIHEEIIRGGKFKLLICNSQMMKDDLVARFKLQPSKAVVIYPEVNLKKFRVDNVEAVRAEWRKKFGFSEADFVFGIITSGNFKKRNLGMLIDGFAEIAKTEASVKLFIAGGNLDEKYLKQIKALGISDKVQVAEPIIDVKNYYYLIDTFILPAHIEEFGRSVLEAMFCGKPVITTDKVGAHEIMEGKAREYIMKPGDQQQMMVLMKRAMHDQDVGITNHMTAKKYSADSQNDNFGKTLREFKII